MLARSQKGLGAAQRDGNLSSNCSLRKPSNAPPRSADWIQAPGACGPGLQGAWGQTSQITIFRKPPGGRLAKAWVSAETAASEVGTWRETKPGYPPYPPPRFGLEGERKRVFTLSAFGNHPTRPPRSADSFYLRGTITLNPQSLNPATLYPKTLSPRPPQVRERAPRATNVSIGTGLVDNLKGFRSQRRRLLLWFRA